MAGYADKQTLFLYLEEAGKLNQDAFEPAGNNDRGVFFSF